MSQKSADNLEQDLIKIVERCTLVINGLEGNAAFQTLVEDFKNQAADIDANWHLTTDMGRLNEMRITKFATNALIMAIEHYKYDLNRALEQLAHLKQENNGEGE